MLGVILTENSFEFNGKNYLQTHGVAMGTKTAVSLANIFMAENGNITLMTISPFGTVKEMKWIISLNKLTHFTQQ